MSDEHSAWMDPQVDNAARFAQMPHAGGLPVTVKNTFLDLEDTASDDEWCKYRRHLKTCPPFLDRHSDSDSDPETTPGGLEVSEPDGSDAFASDQAPLDHGFPTLLRQGQLRMECQLGKGGEKVSSAHGADLVSRPAHSDRDELASIFESLPAEGEGEEQTMQSKGRARNRRGGRNQQRGNAEVIVEASLRVNMGVHIGAADEHHAQMQSQRSAGRKDGRRSRCKSRLWCHFYISPEMLRQGFDLNKKIIGRGGSCTKGIYTATGAKVRLRGRGSGFLENVGHGRNGDQQEAPVPLMLVVTSDEGDQNNFQVAVRMAVELLTGIEARFAAFCRQSEPQRRPSRGMLPTPNSPEATLAKGQAFWVGDISAEALRCSAPELKSVRIVEQ